MIKVRSLAFRLFLASAGWSIVLLLIGALVLSNLYRDKVQNSFEKTLTLYLENLIAKVDWRDDGTIFDVSPMTDPRFDTILSGWYWQITELDSEEGVQFASRSLSMDTLAIPLRQSTLHESGTTIQAGPKGENLQLTWNIIRLGDADTSYLFAVAGNLGDIEQETGSFRRSVISALSILGLALMITTFFQVRYGLQPLRNMVSQISSIRAGQTSRLDGDFPSEVEPLAAELNELISSNTSIIERARTHVGNLAHALKTPLSIISNEGRQLNSQAGSKIVEQADLMLTQITHHLDRARVAGQANVIGAVTDVLPTAEAIKRTMERLHIGKNLTMTLSCPKSARFAGEKQDLEEILGNLVENACKWANNRVEISIELAPSLEPSPTEYLHIIVDDDGSGLSAVERDAMLRRGTRFDETKPGSGLGLSIVAELIDLYKGNLVLASAPLGGLRVELKLPSV